MRKTRYACDFCEKTQDEVRHIILGPREVAICDECVNACVDFLAKKEAASSADEPSRAQRTNKPS